MQMPCTSALLIRRSHPFYLHYALRIPHYAFRITHYAFRIAHCTFRIRHFGSLFVGYWENTKHDWQSKMRL